LERFGFNGKEWGADGPKPGGFSEGDLLASE